MNYIKAVVSCSRGVGSAHMISIINSLIRSLLEYACPLFLATCPSSLNSLEVVYNAALRVATGLPMCTPIPVLRREAGVSSLCSRFQFLTHAFFVRLLSTSPDFLSADPSVGVSGYLSTGIEDFVSLYNVDPRHFLQFSWPDLGPAPPSLQFMTHSLLFQDSAIPSEAVVQAWYDFRSYVSSATVIASDASKDNDKTAIAIYNETAKSGTAFLIPQINSIFTAEALGLYVALSLHVNCDGFYLLLTDSLSTLKALQNISLRSPRIILMLHALLLRLLQNTSVSITLIWSPGHKGIPPNEAADALARNGPYSSLTLNWIAPEDLKSQIRKNWLSERSCAWMSSDYSPNFSHLTEDNNFRRWTNSRREDVWITLWRTRMWFTNYRLFKIKRSASPLCLLCCTVDTPDHALLHCFRFNDARTRLFASLGILSPPTYSDLITSALRSRKGVAALLRFSAVVSAS